ncbi:deoxynucleoside kinase [Streptomyces luteireticuli]|uniref:Thymidylate kinase-like domain-containing protein n=1 Tax=Streptomyces luteireticuli TaxID=173858 RepID=A0ABN0YJB0_9ACTN
MRPAQDDDGTTRPERARGRAPFAGRSAPGRFPYIALEGLNGAGKSTLRNRLEQSFWAMGTNVYTIGQHSWQSPGAARIILDVKERRRAHPPERVRLAFLDDRKTQSEHILSRVLREVPVIGDRSLVSDMVYLQVLDGIPAAGTFALYRRHGVRLPDLIIHVEVPPDTALANLAKRDRRRKPHENPRQMRALADAYESVLWGNTVPGLPPVLRHRPAIADDGTSYTRPADDITSRAIAALGLDS